ILLHFITIPPTPQSTLFPYTTLFRSTDTVTQLMPKLWSKAKGKDEEEKGILQGKPLTDMPLALQRRMVRAAAEFCNLSLEFRHRSEEHTSELQSRSDLVCRLLLEKKK